MTPDWDKLFPKSDKVDHEKVTFHNHYGIELAADLFKPKGEAGYFDADDNLEARNKLRAQIAAQRTADYAAGDEEPQSAPDFGRLRVDDGRGVAHHD